VSEGGFLATAGTTFFDPGSIDNQAGTVSLVLGTLIGPDPGASGSGTLLTVRLAALNLPVPPAGSGRFSLLNVQVYDAALNPVSVLLHDHVTAVPEPASWALALAGAAALGAWCRRQRRPGSATTALAA
jgi:general secretion pathway protein D